MIPTPRIRHAVAALLLITAALASPAGGALDAPGGLTAFSRDGRVELTWVPVGDSVEYRVYRGSVPQAVDALVGTTTGTRFVDTTPRNGERVYYGLRAIAGGETSPASSIVGAEPQGASCSEGNQIVRENCLPGTTRWKVDPGTAVSNLGIEGFTTTPSIDAGDTVDLKVNTVAGAPYHVEIYRTGWYRGSQGRLISTVERLTGVQQPSCVRSTDLTGHRSCSNWSTTTRLTTSPDWPSGVYLIRLQREDVDKANQVMLTVRDDDGGARVHFNLPDATYQAYNNHGGRSLYVSNSSGDNTLAGTPQAVKVSFDRPFQQTATRQRDFFTFTDISAIGWLERQGYSVSYSTSVDLHLGRVRLTDHRAIVLGAHHEYWSAEMRSALKAARDAGVHILSMGANQMYWKIRFENAGRTMVAYKTTKTGVEDPSGIDTGTWRDPNGAADPEVRLLGGQYIGDNDSTFFPLRVTYDQGRHRMWRHTSAAALAPGQTATIGSQIVGWEWDARTRGSDDPPGVQAVSSSPVTGDLLLDEGATYGPGPATVESTIYTAPSGAIVFNAGTNFWMRGLAPNSRGAQDLQPDVQQATANLLADMGVRPATPSGVVFDPPGPPQVESTAPGDGAVDVPVGSSVRARFDRPMDPATITPANVRLRRAADGAPVAATVRWDDLNDAAVIEPDTPLAIDVGYEATVTTGVRDLAGNAPAAATTWRFTTEQPAAPVVVTVTPARDATTVPADSAVTAAFDKPVAADSVAGAFLLTGPGGAEVAAATAYDADTRTARLVPTEPLGLETTYTARLTRGIRAADGPSMTKEVTWSFTTRRPFVAEQRSPAPMSSGISNHTAVTAVFNRAADPATVNAQTFTLTAPGGEAVPATVTYDVTARLARLRPLAPLALLTTYTASLSRAAEAADGQPLGQPAAWTFTTGASSPPAPAAVEIAPAAGATNVDRLVNVVARFDREIDPSTLDGQSVQLRDAGGTPVAATARYEGAERSIVLDPLAPLSREARYTARLTTAVRSVDGVPLATDLEWSFTTVRCPCRLMESALPARTGITVRDGRPLPGPWSYELGTRVRVDRPMLLKAFHFYKDKQETGAHTGTLWSAAGTRLASAAFTGESVLGWQRQALAEPVLLEPGTDYVVSVNANAYFVVTQYGLQAPLADGPLQSSPAPNGVYGAAAGVFPTQSYRSSNYFVDAEVGDPPPPPPNPVVRSTDPARDAIGVAPGASVRATFDKPIDAATLDAESFTLTDAQGRGLAATVQYDASTRTAVLTPAEPLSRSASYTAELTAAVRSDDGFPMLAAYRWSFTVMGPAPSVASVSPAGGAAGVDRGTAVTATFVGAMDAASLNAATFTLAPAGGPAVAASVTYDAGTRTARLVPSASLAAATQYTATITTGARAADGAPLETPVSWSFTSGDCPCSLIRTTPSVTNISTRDGRPSPGPWTRELGMKFEVTRNATLLGFRYFRASKETGAHSGRLWLANGTAIASAAFAGESASGWQQTMLATPVELVPGQRYVASVGFNAFYSATQYGLQTGLSDGPVRSVADGANGVFSDAAGIFPTKSYRSSNYFVDVIVR